MEKTIHQGRNVERFRKMFGLKQEALAARLGEDWNQKKISYLESKEIIDDAILDDVARALNITSEAIKHFSEEIAFAFISSSFSDTTVASYIHTNAPVYHSEKALTLLENVIREKDALIRELIDKLAKK